MIVRDLYKKLLEEQVLKEVYSQTDLKPVSIVLKVFLNCILGKSTEKDLAAIEKQYKIEFEVVDTVSENHLVQKAKYFREDDYTRIYLYSDSVERLLKNPEIAKQLIEEVFAFTTHENTHKQQFDKKGNDSIRYNVPDPEIDPYGYTKHYTEIDAYARQTGFLLRKEFPELSAEDILKKVSKDEYESEMARDYISTYKMPLFKNKESHRFFHTLYQYLEGREID